MGRYDTLLEDPKKVTPPAKETNPPVKQDATPKSKPVIKTEMKKANNNASKQAITDASTLASNQDKLVESIRKTVKHLGKEVSFIRLTPEEKARLADIVYTYKRQGTKTSENEIGRIGLNYLIADYQANGKESVLAKVIAALNA
jgi:hypothetical protein